MQIIKKCVGVRERETTSKSEMKNHSSSRISKRGRTAIIHSFFLSPAQCTHTDPEKYTLCTCFVQTQSEMKMICYDCIFQVNLTLRISISEWWIDYIIDSIHINKSIFPESIIWPITMIFRWFFLDRCNRLRLLPILQNPSIKLQKTTFAFFAKREADGKQLHYVPLNKEL